MCLLKIQLVRGQKTCHIKIACLIDELCQITIACLIDSLIRYWHVYQLCVACEANKNICLKWNGCILLWSGHCQDNQTLICLYRGCPLGMFIDGWWRCDKWWFNISFREWYLVFRKFMTSEIVFKFHRMIPSL
jgi:hypothetical protein